MASELSPAASGAVADRNRAAQVMALRLAQTGSGLYTPEVETYQLVWNASRAATREQAQIVGLSAAQANQITPSLVVDGMYGPKTAATLCVIVGDPCPPQRADGMPVWVAQNQDRVNTLAPPSNPPVVDMIDPNPDGVAPPDVNPQPDISSGSTVIEATIHSEAPAGPPEVTLAPESEDELEPMVAAETYLDFNEPGLETPIMTTRPASRVPWIAVILGATALGGTFWYFNYGKRRRA